MSEAIVVGVLTLVGSLVGTFFANRKSSALIAYRLEELEKKVNKHNCIIERTYQLEEKTSVQDEQIKVINNRLKDAETGLEKVRERI